jgi:beta-glucosidase
VFSGISWQATREKKPQIVIDYNCKWFYFSDLNRDGKLDKYEDYRLSTQDRIQDLINKMTDDERQVCSLELNARI